MVDDSLTVRELEKKLLQTRGYEVEIAVDGMDAWNVARTGHFDLVITDVDMPRMDGIEFVTLIKKDSNLKSLPVMIVSYKDRAEDRRRGLEAGADYYLAKASFHDEALLQAVVKFNRRGHRVRIGIVNDSPMAAELLRRLIRTSEEHQIAWIARDGAEAVKLCERDLPELVLMDLIMPYMDGAEATRRIMSRTPCPILIVTATVGGNAAKVFEALGAGAIDAIDTPTVIGSQKTGRALLLKIQGIERQTSWREHLADDIVSKVESTANKLILIGASAGGPAALVEVLSAFPEDFSPAIVIVQHIDQLFAPGLVEWLNGHSKLPVRLAFEGDSVKFWQRFGRRQRRSSCLQEFPRTWLHRRADRKSISPFRRCIFRECSAFLSGTDDSRPFDWHGAGRCARFKDIARCWISYDCAGPKHQRGVWHAESCRRAQRCE